jgi:hypothetical protein
MELSPLLEAASCVVTQDVLEAASCASAQDDPRFYETQRFITEFTRAFHWCLS